MRLQILKCPACGTNVNVDSEKDTFLCNYCKNTINIIKPITVNNFVAGLNEVEHRQYSNYLKILNQSMLAGNFKEAYEYCNKALEINPNSSELWENKAICIVWTITVSDVEKKAGEITSYLNASRINNPDSITYLETSKSIASILYLCILYKYHLIIGKYEGSYSNLDKNYEREIISCIKLFETCFYIYNDPMYLETALNFIANGAVQWVLISNSEYVNSNIAEYHSFDAVSKIENMVETIKKIKPDFEFYEEEERKTTEEIFIGITVVIIVVVILILIFTL